jgi:lipopolysaccharide transport system permease protein
MATEQLQSASRSLRRSSSARGKRALSVIEPRRPGLRYALGELWRYRTFTVYFGGRFVRKRYMQTWLGLAWLPLRPTLNVGMKLLVFGGLVGISAGKTPYPVFFLFASAAWQLFSESLSWSTRSLYVSRSLLRVFHVPRLVVIASAAIPSFIDFLIGVLLATTCLGYYLVRAHYLYLDLTWRSPIYVLVGLAFLLLLGVGLGLLGAVAGARARDVRFILGYVVGLLYYLTPIIYPFQQIPNKYKPLAELNPLTGAIELFKAGLFATDRPSWNALAVTAIAVAVIWGPGLWLFHRQEIREW